MTDETAKELAAAMLKLAEAVNALNSKASGLGGFTVHHQHYQTTPTWQPLDYRNPYYTGGGTYT